MRGSNKLSQTTSRLIDGLEATREELPAIQRSREELEPVTQSLKIVSGAPPRQGQYGDQIWSFVQDLLASSIDQTLERQQQRVR